MHVHPCSWIWLSTQEVITWMSCFCPKTFIKHQLSNNCGWWLTWQDYYFRTQKISLMSVSNWSRSSNLRQQSKAVLPAWNRLDSQISSTKFQNWHYLCDEDLLHGVSTIQQRKFFDLSMRYAGPCFQPGSINKIIKNLSLPFFKKSWQTLSCAACEAPARSSNSTIDG